MMTPLQRWFSKVEIPTGDPNDCWVWQDAPNNQGYGTFWTGAVLASSHRFAYAQFIGPIPEGYSVHHKCSNRICCNPSHLEAITQRDNLLLGRTLIAENVAKTHCPAGHEYNDSNTYIYRTSRQCKACRLVKNRVYKQRKRWGVFEPTVIVGTP